MPSNYKRRTFLQQAGVVSAAGLLRFGQGKHWTGSVNEAFPEPDNAKLRAYALAAVDAARAAGADFADVHVAMTRTASTVVQYTKVPGESPPPLRAITWAGLHSGYSVRAIVDGSWGSASGTQVSAENLVRVAQAAVRAARANRRLHPRALALAPVPANVTGAWRTPIERDPLTVPLGDQGRLIVDAMQGAVARAEVGDAQLGFDWRSAVAIFAATDNRVFTQRLLLAQPHGYVTATVGREITDKATVTCDFFRSGGYGYEAVRERTLAEDVRGAAERAVTLATAARAPKGVEIGRADLVLGAGLVAGLLEQTLMGALNLPIALGYVADTVTSFAAPPAEMLGQYQVASPLLTVHADRTRPRGAASVRWDDEGVEPEPYTLIDAGKIVDYHTDRETAMQLADWYAKRGRPIRAHGVARRHGDAVPVVATPNVTVAPSASATTVDDLIAGTTRGYYVESALGASDQQFLTGQYSSPHFHVREIRRGRLGGYINNAAFQFTTVPFWKSVDGLGGKESVQSMEVGTDNLSQFNALQVFPNSTYETVPVRVRQVNVLNTGRTA